MSIAPCIAFPWRFANHPLLPRVTKPTFFTHANQLCQPFFSSFFLFFLSFLNFLSIILSSFSLSMAPPSELLLKIFSDDLENETPEKCRERRRRRIQLRRSRYTFAPIQQLQSPPPRKEMTNYVPTTDQYFALLNRTTLGDKTTAMALPVVVDSSWTSLTSASCGAKTDVNPMPVNGWISIQGFSDSMDDRLFVKEEFCRSDLFGGKPLHFFAVYDGHGGPHVSTLCKNMMHTIMAEELMRLSTEKAPATSDGGGSSSGNGTGSSSPAERIKNAEVGGVEEWENLVRAALEKSFLRMDEVALSTCACGKSAYLGGCQAVDVGFLGSTAVVAIVAPHHVVVANCGDSRAVLCRAGRAIPLSLDHKPERPDELERIRAAGGKLVYQNGVRVYGILNMSRALGDNFLKKVITSQPETSITERDPEDECLILATDGLWDVMSDALACEVASTCLRDGSCATSPRSHYSGQSVKIDGEVLFPSKSAFAAAILCRLALGRGSCDNISVIVVDLKKHLAGKAK
ncbi:Phosphatase 2C family protein [Theobroma cacao]|uniref:protein-serine/threonine phosphatase n=1 Tax=Theobroma cacao TaxID=3641 RepID=A0A061G0C8_THECC|nr:Phosphatase 2C family protein [Theobroma cacao]